MEQLLHALAEAQRANDAERMAIYIGGIARLLDMQATAEADTAEMRVAA